MNENRKKTIDNLVNELKGKYDAKSLDGLKQIAKDREIRIIEDDEVILPTAWKKKKNGQKYILLNKKFIGNDFILGHELGHHLLEHLEDKNPFEETEANYFSKQLLDKKQMPYLEALVNSLYLIIEKPILSLKCAFFPDLDKKNCLNIIKNYEQQNGKI